MISSTEIGVPFATVRISAERRCNLAAAFSGERGPGTRWPVKIKTRANASCAVHPTGGTPRKDGHARQPVLPLAAEDSRAASRSSTADAAPPARRRDETPERNFGAPDETTETSQAVMRQQCQSDQHLYPRYPKEARPSVFEFKHLGYVQDFVLNPICDAMLVNRRGSGETARLPLHGFASGFLSIINLASVRALEIGNRLPRRPDPLPRQRLYRWRAGLFRVRLGGQAHPHRRDGADWPEAHRALRRTTVNPATAMRD